MYAFVSYKQQHHNLEGCAYVQANTTSAGVCVCVCVCLCVFLCVHVGVRSSLSCAEEQLGDNLVTSQPESGLLSLPDSRAVRHSLHAEPVKRERERERERERAERREGGQGVALGREGGRRGVEEPGECLRLFSGGKWDVGQGD